MREEEEFKELEIFTCNSCSMSKSKNYFKIQGGVKTEDDENICDDCSLYFMYLRRLHRDGRYTTNR